MAEGSREYFRGTSTANILTSDSSGISTINGALTTQQWNVVKSGMPLQTTAYYPTEWKVEDKKTLKHQQLRNLPGVSTVSLSTIDIKPMLAQVNLPQVVTQQPTASWSPSGTVISSTDAGWSTIKWEAPNIVQKPSTINTAGLQFVSAQPVQTVVPSNQSVTGSASTTHAVLSSVPTCSSSVAANLIGGHGSPISVNVIHGGRKTNPIIESFKCELCNQVYASIASLQSHITTVHEIAGASKKKGKINHSTLHCEYKYSGITLGDAISSTQSVIPTVLVSPIIYGKDGKPKKEKRRNWQCDVCQNRFTRKDHLQKHVSAVHMKVRPFDCKQCGQKFSQKHHLRAHTLARHEDDKIAAKAFACQQCPKRFTRSDHLERHVESVHEKRKAFECNVCQTQFGRKHHLSKHILAVHAKVKPYGCHLCDQSFIQRHHLGSHIMQAHQPPVHEESDGTKTYVCAICSHRFKRKDHLKKHVETVHEKTRAFACQICDKRFGQKYHLAIHVSAVHEGKKPYECTMCAHKSARKSGLQRHMKTVHNMANTQQSITVQQGNHMQQGQQIQLTQQQVTSLQGQQGQLITLPGGQITLPAHLTQTSSGQSGQTLIQHQPQTVSIQQLMSPPVTVTLAPMNLVTQ